MHTAAAARGRRVGALIVEHALDEARRRGYCRISLETGAQAEFAPARALYRRLGFEECGRFGDYPDSGASTFMTQLTAGS